MKITNEQIYEKLIDLELQFQIFNNSKRSNKMQLLEQSVKTRGRVEVSRVQSILGRISRPWALNLMKKLGKENSFKFVIGDRSLKRPSLIIYEEAKAIKEKYLKLKLFVDKELDVTFAQIREHLIISNKEGWLESVQEIVNLLIEKEKGYIIKNGNRLHKNTVNK